MEDIIGFKESNSQEGFLPEEKKPLLLDEQASQELAGKLEASDPQMTTQEADQAAKDVSTVGYSAALEDSLTAQAQDQTKTRVDEAAKLALELGGETAMQTLIRLGDVDGMQALQNNVNTNMSMNNPRYTDEEIWSMAMGKEEAIDAEIQEEIRGLGAFDGSTFGDVIEFFTGGIPGRSQLAAASFGKMIEEKYGFESDKSAAAYLATGEYLEDISEFGRTLLDPAQRIEFIRDVNDFAREASDWGAGPNDFIRLGIVGQVLREWDQSFDPNSVNIDRGFNNAISVLDALVIGKFAKNTALGLRTSRTAIGGSSKGSASAKINRLNPDVAAESQAAVIADSTGQTAHRLGTTLEDTVIDHLLPGLEEAGYSVKVSEGVVDRTRELVVRISNRQHDIAVDLPDAQKAAQAARTAERLEKTRGVHFHGNASSVQATDDLIVVNARYGKTGRSGFAANEIDEAVKRMQRLYPNAKVSVDVVEHSGEIKKITVKEAIKSDDELIAALKQELKVEAEGAVKRADTTGSKALRGKAKGAAFDVKKANQMIRYLKGEKGARNVPRALKEEAEALVEANQAGGNKRLRSSSVKSVIKDLQARKLEAEKAGAEAVATEKASAAGKLAKAELSRLEQGQPLKSPEWKRRLKEMKKENVRSVTREEAVKDPTNEFFMNVQFSKQYDSTESFLNLEDIYVGGANAHYLADISSGLSKQLAQTMIRGFDEAQGVEKMLSEMLEPFTKASNKAKAYIYNKLKSGDKDGVVYTSDDLLNDLESTASAKLKQEILDGYFAFRATSDTIYGIKNKKLYDVLTEEGFLHVRVGDEAMIAKPLMGGTQPDQVWDPLLKIMRNTEEVKAEGLQVYKTRNRFQTGANNYANHVAIRAEDTVEALPNQVLKYNTGYVPRIYNEQYFVTVRQTGAGGKLFINGKRAGQGDAVTKATYSAKSRKSAEAHVEQLKRETADEMGITVDQLEAQGFKIDYRNSRELTMGEYQTASFNVERSTGGLFYSKRGEHVKDAADELAEVENPVEAMQRMITSAARETSLEPVLELMRKRWLAGFGKYTQNKYPTSVDMIQDADKLGNPEIRKAQAMWQYIENATNGAVVTRKWRADMVRLGEWVESKGFDKLGQAIRTSERDPFSVMRGITFLTTIVANPLRQVFIQAQGALLLAGVDGFGAAMAKAHQAPMLMIGTAIGKSKRDFAQKVIAKTGLDKDVEFMAMMKGLDESGLIQAIDSHLLSRDALRTVEDSISASRVRQGLTTARNFIAQDVVGNVKRYGFDLGEQMNITTAYTIAFQRKKTQLGIKGVFKPSKQDLADIAGDARQMALTMNTPGAMGYQTGVLSLATQFLSVQHKAWLAGARGIPGLSKYGNKVFTESEGRRILMGQVLLYGASGWGLDKLIDAGLNHFGVEMSPEAREALMGGTYDYTMNKLLENLTGDDTNLAFSSNIAAGGGFGHAITALIWDPIFNERPLPELFMGPSLNTYSKIGKIMESSRLLMSAKLEGKDLTEEQMTIFKHDLSRMLSGYNNWMKGQWMLKGKTWLDKNGHTIDESLTASPTEAMVYSWLGVTDADVSNYYATVKNLASIREGHKQTAKDFVERVNQVMAHHDKIGSEYGYMDQLVTALKMENMVLSALDAPDREQVMKLAVKEMKNRGMFDSLSSSILRAAQSGTYGSKMPDLVNDLLRKGLIDSRTHGLAMAYVDEEFKE